MSWIEKLGNIPLNLRQLLLVLAIVIPLINPIGLPLDTSPMTKTAYNYIDSIPEGNIAVYAYDMTPGIQAELGGLGRAIIYHLMKSNIKIIFICTGATAPPYVVRDATPISNELNLEYGEDWVNLGYVAGGESAVAAFFNDIENTIPSDYFGTPMKDIPMLKEIKNHNHIDMALYLGASADAPGIWARQVNTPYGIPLFFTVSGGMAAAAMPYYPNQIVGLLEGIRSGAEYELLIRRPGSAIAGMDSFSIVTLVVLLLLVLGNISTIYERVQRSKTQ